MIDEMFQIVQEQDFLRQEEIQRLRISLADGNYDFNLIAKPGFDIGLQTIQQSLRIELILHIDVDFHRNRICGISIGPDEHSNNCVEIVEH